MTELKINPVFRDKIPPLSKEEFERLEENILSDGVVREPLVVWNGTIIDGHHRYAIIQKHPEIPYTIREMEFSDEWAAIAWMCANQLGRRNISETQRMVLTADYYNARKHTESFKGNQYTNRGEDQNGPKQKNYHGTRSIVAEELGVSQKNVLKSVEFAAGLDAAEEVSEGFREKVLSGEIKASKKEIAALRAINNEERSKAVEAIKKQDKLSKPSKPKPERRYRPKEVIEKEKAGLRFTDKVVNEILSKTETEEYTLDDFTEEFSCIAADTVSRLRRMVSIRNRIVSDNAAEVTKLFFDLTEKIEKITEAF